VGVEMKPRSLSVVFDRVRVFSEEELETKYFWQHGTTPPFVILPIAMFFAFFYLLTKPSLFAEPLPLAYIFLFFASSAIMFWIGFERGLYKEGLIAGLAGALLGFGLLVLLNYLFQTLATVQLLETPPPGGLTPIDNFIYQLIFVAIMEETFFRQTLPYILSEFFLRRIMSVERARQVSLIGIMSIAFGIIHFAAYELNFWTIFNAFIAGAVLGWIRYGRYKKDDNGQPVYDEIIIEGQSYRAKRYLFGGFFSCYLAHLAYNIAMLQKLLILPT
jgi:membrane protease YdiL (CAAX protease family)